MPTDLELLEAWRAGDRTAGSELFERYFDSLLRFFGSKGCKDVEDLVQRTFLSCTEARDRLALHSGFKPYLFAIARNELYDDLKRSKRQPSPLNSAVQSLADLGISVSGVIAVARDDRWLIEGMSRIPLDDQLALELYYWEDLSASEVGEILGIPEPAVRSRIRRAKEKLRDALEVREQAGRPALARLDMDATVRALGRALLP